MVHALRRDGPVAVIGVGGGRDIVAAVRAGHPQVTGIEINDLIVHLHTHTMADFSQLLTLPGVRIVQDEARAFLASHESRYQVIVMSLIDTWAATGMGAYALSENSLYTVEGWQTVLRRLADDGVFSVSRWYDKDSPGETARLIALAYETLWTLGVEHPRAHVAMLQSGSVATLLVSRTPLSQKDLTALMAEAKERRYNIVLTPTREPRHPLLARLATASTERELLARAQSERLDLRPPTDDRPFFFNMAYPWDWLTSPGDLARLDFAFLGNLTATRTLVQSVLIAAVLTLVAVFVPLVWTRRRNALPVHVPLRRVLAAMGYFGLLGVGFMFVEMSLLSRIRVVLGDPTLSLSVLLGGMIFFLGMGSLTSARVLKHARSHLYPLVPAVAIVAVAYALPLTATLVAGQALWLRVIACLMVVAVPAWLMGPCFPLGLAKVRVALSSQVGPWMWGINGATSVLASGLALVVAMTIGTQATLLCGAAMYAAMTLSLRGLVRASPPELW